MSGTTTVVVSKAMEFTQTEIQEMRTEIIAIFEGRSRRLTRIHRRLYRFRDNMVIKRGHILRSKDEFDNQLHVWTLVDPRIVRVPQPIDQFQHTLTGRPYSTGFLVMEYVANGVQPSESLSDAQIDQVASITDYLTTFKGTVPGGLMGGAWNCGVMFGDFYAVLIITLTTTVYFENLPTWSFQSICSQAH